MPVNLVGAFCPFSFTSFFPAFGFRFGIVTTLPRPFDLEIERLADYCDIFEVTALAEPLEGDKAKDGAGDWSCVSQRRANTTSWLSANFVLQMTYRARWLTAAIPSFVSVRKGLPRKPKGRVVNEFA